MLPNSGTTSMFSMERVSGNDRRLRVGANRIFQAFRGLVHVAVLVAATSARAEWTEQTTPTTETLFAVDFVDTVNGYAAGTNGIIIKTTDGGATWTAQII